MRPTFALLLVLAGCAGGGRAPESASHDLGGVSFGWAPAAIAVGAVEMRAGAPLASNAMHYRLEYADPTRRAAYGENRWAAPPAELIERALARGILSGQGESSGGCRLRIGLDELIQVFESPQQGAILLETRAQLTPARGEEILARRAFQVRVPTPTPDARGGVKATRASVERFAGELHNWLAETARTQPQLASRCRTA